MDQTISVRPISKAIAQARARVGLSLRALAERSGVPHATIHQIETGRRRRPRWEHIAALAQVLGLPLEELAASEARAGEGRVG